MFRRILVGLAVMVPVLAVAAGVGLSERGKDQKTPRMQGEWSKDRLQVTREGRRGKMTQSFAVEEDGRVLVIRTKMESDGSRPAREFKRVYRRMGT